MLYLGADHRGFALKESLKRYLTRCHVPLEDYGAAELTPGDDFVDYGIAVADAVARNPEEHRGILICGSGIGMDVVANKHRGIRAALVRSIHQAVGSRRDDNANVLVLDADETNSEDAQEIAKIWLDTPFSNEPRYQRRLDKIAELEQRAFCD